MSIFSTYIREEKYYSENELKRILKYSDTNKFEKFKSKLFGSGILKVKKPNEKDLEDTLLLGNNIENTSKGKFKFKFVGIISFDNRLIYVYPKYLRGEGVNYREKLKQVIKVIQKYSIEKSRVKIDDIDYYIENDRFGKTEILPIMLFLLNDFQEFGELRYEKDDFIINGNGITSWQRTVDLSYPIIKNNRPIYTDIYTSENNYDDLNYFTLLHRKIIHECNIQFQKNDVGEFFGIPEIMLEVDDDFEPGEVDYVIDKIDQQLANTFEDRQITVLKAMKSYLLGEKIIGSSTNLQLFGTTSFNLVWEYACSKVFKDQKEKTLSQINSEEAINLEPSDQFNVESKLTDYIDKPKWTKKDQIFYASKTLEPDFLKFEQTERGTVFYILDAKYYCPEWKIGKDGVGNIVRQPGVEDIVKQYTYNIAFKDLLNKNKVDFVKNYFIIPKLNNLEINSGVAQLSIFEEEPISLNSINVRAIDPDFLFSKFLKSEHISLTYLD